jgi:putative ABC transport system permease protein
VFASSAALLALIGLYGLVSSDVTRRTREIGVRTALGARPKDILTMVVREAVILSSVGLILGLVASLAVSRVLESMLYEVKPADATTMFSAVLSFLCVAAGAAALAGRKAAWLDPVRALRD